jgi:F0F1-type ATP synthase membrane subunit b/b'
MDATLKALAELLLEAVPTIVFFLFLTLYLKYVFFEPMARIMEERRRQTEGVRELARRAFEEADKKTADFERALQIARAQIHSEHEALRRQWTDEQEAAVAEARAEADKQIQQARAEIAQEVERTQAELDTRVEDLSAQISNAVIERRAA